MRCLPRPARPLRDTPLHRQSPLLPVTLVDGYYFGWISGRSEYGVLKWMGMMVHG